MAGPGWSVHNVAGCRCGGTTHVDVLKLIFWTVAPINTRFNRSIYHCFLWNVTSFLPNCVDVRVHSYLFCLLLGMAGFTEQWRNKMLTCSCLHPMLTGPNKLCLPCDMWQQGVPCINRQVSSSQVLCWLCGNVYNYNTSTTTSLHVPCQHWCWNWRLARLRTINVNLFQGPSFLLPWCGNYASSLQHRGRPEQRWPKTSLKKQLPKPPKP